MAKEYLPKDEVMAAFTHGFPEAYIEKIVPADVRHVVLCKDCKYGVPTKNGFLNDMIACENEDSPCSYSSWLCQLDWFCADGERREVQDDN